ncbi:hypothetical protein BCV70DRAFT_194782 [Testicularia cyperi]|uniref:Zn(2)-C6 fungal-type domain-containing protein n=1 Tax=Testicularia cyperi TaxID=1882483 RepID=A0A317XHR7_9BASI|nr:hypothetical protein BCV70DRAFT_194782 [Testicularia cyperi]
MSDAKPMQKGSVLSNIEPSTDIASPPATSPQMPPRSQSPDEMAISDQKDLADQSVTKDGEPETKKRKRSQRACIRCRGQKLKCDGVFPCARCLKLKLICKEPSEAGSGTPASSKVSSDERDLKANLTNPSSRPPSQASLPIHPAGLPAAGHNPNSGTSSSTHSHSHSQSHSHSHSNSNAHLFAVPSAPDTTDRYGHSLPDAVRRIEQLERTVSRLVARVEGPQHAASNHHHPHAHPSGHSAHDSSFASRQQGSATAGGAKSDRKRTRADSPDDSDAEVDELAQDGQSESSAPVHSLPPSASNSRILQQQQQHPQQHQQQHQHAADDPNSYARGNASRAPPPSLSSQNAAFPEPYSDRGPIHAGLVSPDIAQLLLDIFFSYCHVFAPFLDLADTTGSDLNSLSASEPFLLSVLLTIAAVYQDTQARMDNKVRLDTHAKLSADVRARVGRLLCEPSTTLGTVQALLLIAYWPQAFPGCPDERLLATYATALLQRLSFRDGARMRNSTDAKLASATAAATATVWTSLRAFEALSAFDSGRAMDLTEQDLALAKGPRSVRSSIPTPYLVRAIPILREVQIWLNELSLGSMLAGAELVKPLGRLNLNHDWDRFKYLQSQLFDVEKRWLSSETDCSRLERIVGLVDRWTLQTYLAAIALKAVELGRVAHMQGADRAPGYDARFDEEASRFVSAYRGEVRQSCQVLMDIFTDPEISGALTYAPGYMLRRFCQAAVAATSLLDFHDAESTRANQELIYLCTKRIDQLSLACYTPFASTLLAHVKASYERVIGSPNKDVKSTNAAHDAAAATNPLQQWSDHRRWTSGDIFPLFFGIGSLADPV